MVRNRPLVLPVGCRLRHQAAHGAGIAARAQAGGRRRIGGAVCRRALRRAKPSSTWPSRCSRAFMAEIRANSAWASVLPRFVELANRYGSLTRGVLAERAKAAKARSMPRPPRCSGRSRAGWARWSRRWKARSAGAVEVRRRHGPRPSSARPQASVSGCWETRLAADRVVVACEAHSGAILLESLDAPPRRAAGRGALQLVDDRGAGFRFGRFPPPAGGLRIPGAQDRTPPPDGLHLGWHQVLPPRAGRQGGGALLHGRADDAAALYEPDETVIPAMVPASCTRSPASRPAAFARVFRWPRSMAQYPVVVPPRMAGNGRARGGYPRIAPGRQCLRGHRHARLHPPGAPGGRENPARVSTLGNIGASGYSIPKETTLCRESAITGRTGILRR